MSFLEVMHAQGTCTNLNYLVVFITVTVQMDPNPNCTQIADADIHASLIRLACGTHDCDLCVISLGKPSSHLRLLLEHTQRSDLDCHGMHDGLCAPSALRFVLYQSPQSGNGSWPSIATRPGNSMRFAGL